MRGYAAVLTGVLVEIMSTTYMWIYTDMEVLDMLFWSIILYFATVCAFLLVTEERRGKREKHNRERKFKVYDL